MKQWSSVIPKHGEKLAKEVILRLQNWNLAEKEDCLRIIFHVFFAWCREDAQCCKTKVFKKLTAFPCRFPFYNSHGNWIFPFSVVSNSFAQLRIWSCRCICKCKPDDEVFITVCNDHSVLCGLTERRVWESQKEPGHLIRQTQSRDYYLFVPTECWCICT